MSDVLFLWLNQIEMWRLIQKIVVYMASSIRGIIIQVHDTGNANPFME